MAETWVFKKTLDKSFLSSFQAQEDKILEIKGVLRIDDGYPVEFYRVRYKAIPPKMYKVFAIVNGEALQLYDASATWNSYIRRDVTFDEPIVDTDGTKQLFIAWLQTNAVKASACTAKAIINGETIIDLTQDTVTADKMVSGVTAHDKSGKQITGTMGELAGLAYTGGAITTHGSGGSYLIPASYFLEDTRYVKGNDETVVNVTIPRTKFGDATVADVVKGKTFSSSEGIAQTGTYVPLDTSDATVTAGDMAYGVVAYGKNGKVYGTINPIDGTSEKAWSDSTIGFEGGLGEIQLAKRIPFPGTLFREGSTVILRALPSEFGNATAADVAKGKTFTSAAGLKVTGTAEGSSARPVNFGIENTDFTEVWIGYAEYPHNRMSSTTVSNGQNTWVAVEEGSGIVIANTEFDGSEFDVVPPSGGYITEAASRPDVTTFIVDSSLDGKTVELLMK